MISRKIMISRNSKTTVITGWQAWLVGALTLVAAWLTLAFLAFMLASLAVTVGVMLMLVVPAVFVVALLGSVLRGRG